MTKLGGESAAHALLEEQGARDGATGSKGFEKHRQSSSESPRPRDLEPIVKQDGSRYLSSDFWSSLSGEVSLPGMLLLWEFFLFIREITN